MVQKLKTHDSERSAVVQRKSQQTAPPQSKHEQVVQPANVLQRTVALPPAALRPADILALQRTVGNRAVQRMLIQRRVETNELRERLPGNLKSGIESLSGMDYLNLHYGSSKPAELNALAYTQATQIPLDPSEDQLLRHEVSHVGERRLGRVQPLVQLKLAVGPANDHYEREADRVAASVMEAPRTAAPSIQRQTSEDEDQEMIQTKSIASSITPLIQRQETPDEEDENPVQLRSDAHSDRGKASVDSGVEHSIERARGGGQPLPDGLLKRMEKSFGADFSGVRVHADSESDSLNRSLRARAFTTGHDLFFRGGEYNPHNRRGQELIAHELTHVIQQNGGKSGKKDLSLKRVIQRDWFDEERGFFNTDPTGAFGNIPGRVGKEARRENYNRDDKRDLANYTLLGLGATSAVARAATDRAQVIDAASKWWKVDEWFLESTPVLSKTGEVMSYMGAASAGLGTAAALVDTYRGLREVSDSARTTQQRVIGAGAFLSGLASSTQQSATTAYHIANLTNPALAGSAQLAAGGAGIATGSIDVLRGIYGYRKAKQNVERLQRIEDNLRHDGLRSAARQAKTTQEMRQSTAKYTMGKGVLTAVGGGLLLGAAAITPVGWLLIGAAGVLAAIGAYRKYKDKKKRAEEVAITELGLTQPMDAWLARVEIAKEGTWRWFGSRKKKVAEVGPSPLELKLKELKFMSPGHFYANFIHKTANELYETGVIYRPHLEAQARQFITTSRATPQRQRQLLARLRGMSYADMLVELSGFQAHHRNPYAVVEQILAGMGLKFDFRKTPPEPNPEKIGKALHD